MALARVNASCDEHDVENSRRQRERRWQGGVAGTRSYSLKRAAMARVPLFMTTSAWALATEDDNHANDGQASWHLGWYPATFVGQIRWLKMYDYALLC